VSEGGLFLGQALMPPTPKGEGAEVWLGKDLEARLTRKVEQVSETEKEAGYRVETRLANPYPYPVVLLLSEVFPRPFRLDFPGATPLPEGYALQATLKPRGGQDLSSTGLTLPARDICPGPLWAWWRHEAGPPPLPPPGGLGDDPGLPSGLPPLPGLRRARLPSR
jgi:hypothetical protein